MKQLLLAAFLCGAVLTAHAQEKQKSAAPANGPAPKMFRPSQDWNYAQAYRSGNLLFISGTVARGPMDKAIAQVYNTLRHTLQQYNLDFSHVVKENLYTTNMEEMSKHYLIRKKFYDTHTPAATWVQVARLLEPDAVLEVELIAEIKKTE